MSAKQSTFRPVIESLEDRCVPTTASLSGGALSIVGSPGFDAINVSLAGSKIKVSGVHQAFRAGSVHEIVVNTLGGNDFIALDARLATPALILCGPGNTTILGDAGNDTVLGSGQITFVGRGGPYSINGVPDGLSAANVQTQSLSLTGPQNGSPATLNQQIAAEANSLVGQLKVGGGQCTDLVNKVLADCGAEPNSDFGINGYTMENPGNYTLGGNYEWGQLVYERYVYSLPYYDSAGVYGSLAKVVPGDVIQFADYLDGNNRADHHSAIVVANLGNGNLQVVQQNIGNDPKVEYGTYHVLNMTQGTVWVYQPQPQPYALP